jgi:hypothetical protein
MIYLIKSLYYFFYLYFKVFYITNQIKSNQPTHVVFFKQKTTNKNGVQFK